MMKGGLRGWSKKPRFISDLFISVFISDSCFLFYKVILFSRDYLARAHKLQVRAIGSQLGSQGLPSPRFSLPSCKGRWMLFLCFPNKNKPWCFWSSCCVGIEQHQCNAGSKGSTSRFSHSAAADRLWLGMGSTEQVLAEPIPHCCFSLQAVCF